MFSKATVRWVPNKNWVRSKLVSMGRWSVNLSKAAVRWMAIKTQVRSKLVFMGRGTVMSSKAAVRWEAIKTRVRSKLVEFKIVSSYSIHTKFWQVQIYCFHFLHLFKTPIRLSFFSPLMELGAFVRWPPRFSPCDGPGPGASDATWTRWDSFQVDQVPHLPYA